MVRGKVVLVPNLEHIEYLTVPELVELFDATPGKVRRMFEQNILAAVRRDGVLKVPSLFLVDGAPLPSLHGTLIMLHDAGYSTEEAVSWLFDDEAGLDVSPIEALRSGRKSEVRRMAQSLAF